MNTGAEAVETAIKVARKWGYQVKGVPAGQAKIVVAGRQLPRPDDHDRQLLHRPGRARRLRAVHPGLPDRAVRRPGRAGRRDRRDHRGRAARADPGRGRACVVPPAGYLPGVRALCTDAQRAVHRRRDPVRPRAAPATRSPATTRASCRTCTCWARRSAAASCRSRRSPPTRDVLGVLQPGQHGSTFGGNPLACAVGTEVVRLLAHRRVPAALGRARRAAARPACDALVGTGLRRGPRPRPVGRRRHRPGADDRPGGLRAADGARRPGQGHPRLDASAWPRRW